MGAYAKEGESPGGLDAVTQGDAAVRSDSSSDDIVGSRGSGAAAFGDASPAVRVEGADELRSILDDQARRVPDEACYWFVAADGTRATVNVDVRIQRGDGSQSEAEAVPVALVREGGNWKLPYESLLSLMER